jgi:AraC-like DNA-binding protein
LKPILTEFGSGKIYKPSLKNGVELHSWNIHNPKGYRKFKLKSPHFHDEFQIGYLKKGLIENDYRNEKITIAPKQLYIIEPKEIHSEFIVNEKEVLFDFIFIPVCLMEEASNDLMDIELGKFAFKELLIRNEVLNSVLLQKLQTAFNSFENTTSLFEREQSLVDFISFVSASQPNLKEQSLQRVSKNIVRNVKDYMIENIFTTISLDTLAKEMSVSKFHLGRIFHSDTNMTLHKYLLNLKICKAKDLLNNDHGIGDVALKLGFTDKSHFIKCFKKATSQTPGEFRNF